MSSGAIVPTPKMNIPAPNAGASAPATPMPVIAGIAAPAANNSLFGKMKGYLGLGGRYRRRATRARRSARRSSKRRSTRRNSRRSARRSNSRRH